MKRGYLVLLTICGLISGSCEKVPEKIQGADAQGHTPPTKYTIEANAEVAESLPLADQQDFEDARRGLIASDPDLRVTSRNGKKIWDQPAYSFIKGEAPDSVNPSLWRQAKLNNIHGLFEVVKGIYQLRGFDLANMTVIEGQTGWILVDPLMSKETGSRAFAFLKKHLPEKPIVAIIFTHSHIDHFGGVGAFLNPQEVADKNVRIIGPRGFMEESVSENVLAGVAMGRRADYMYGIRLAVSERGHIGSGLGKGPAVGTIGILNPNELITATPQKKTIDGLEFIFQNTPHSEAPAELTFYLPELKAYCGAEIVSKTMHNLYTLRGTKVRDALKWSNYIDESIRLFGEAEVYFGSHHWPIWDNPRVIEFLKKQRDTYKYIHDQSMRLANSGQTPREIAEELKLPESLRLTFSNRGYYGTLSHNAKAVYQHYFGWYDGNPANLNPLPPVDSAKRYVRFMGGAENVLKQAQVSFDEGEYRWVAEVLNHLVFAEPDNTAAKSLLARAYDQLGYQSESGPWRDEYLTAAFELRHGQPEKGFDISGALDLLQETPISRFLESMSARINGPSAEGKNLVVNIVFTDIKESYVMSLENAVLHHRQAPPEPEANATVELTKELYLLLAVGKVSVKDLVMSDDVKFKGSKIDLIRFFSLIEQPTGDFAIVTP